MPVKKITKPIQRTAGKTALSFQEQITAVYLHYVQGIDQHIIAIAMGGVNAGRVNEACTLVRKALNAKFSPREAKHVTDDPTLFSNTRSGNGARTEGDEAG